MAFKQSMFYQGFKQKKSFDFLLFVISVKVAMFLYLAQAYSIDTYINITKIMIVFYFK